MEKFGRIDILINNVGGSTYGRFLDITDEDFRHTFDWCVTSAFIMSQLAAPHMIEAGHGSIVNISSGSARFGIRALTAYCVAKGGLEALTRAMAQELAPKIRVNAIALGSFATEVYREPRHDARVLEKMNEATPLHRLGDVADLGRLSVYLSTRTATRRTRSSMSTAASTRTTRRCRFPTTERGHQMRRVVQFSTGNVGQHSLGPSSDAPIWSWSVCMPPVRTRSDGMPPNCAG